MESQTPRPRQAAFAWLALCDSGDFAKTWEQAASYFRTSVTKQDWENKIHQARRPLGKVITRRLKSSEQATDLAAAPQGQYTIIEYETQFQHDLVKGERVAVVKDNDGQFRVAGYFLI